MAVVEMNIQEALSKKKILEKRLEQKSKLPFIGCLKNPTKAAEEEYNSKLTSNFQSTVALHRNLVALCAAINEHNAKTTIMIAGGEYSKVEAIVRYKNIEEEVKFLNNLEKQIKNIHATLDYNKKKRGSKESEKKYVEKSLNGQKAEMEVIKQLQKQYKEMHTYKIIDPNNIEEKIVEWRNDLEEFKESIHNALIESNVKNVIRVYFED